jgi:hypothetical protein
VARRESGERVVHIAAAEGVCRQLIYRMMKEVSPAPTRAPNWSADEITALRRGRENGATLSEIATSLGRRYHGVKAKVEQLKLPHRPPGRRPSG